MDKETLRGITVAILCGGKGTRLKPTTEVVPKALVPVYGRPMLDHVIEFFRKKCFSRFILCVGYKSEQIILHYKESPGDTEIVFSDAGQNASMLERIWEIREDITDHILVSYGDTFIDLDVWKMLRLHIDSEAAATVVTAGIRSPFGLVESDANGWVRSFVEKPILNYYIGCFALSKVALDFVSKSMLKSRDGTGLVQLFQGLADKKRLGSFSHKGFQATFNTEFERSQVEETLGEFYTYREEE